MEKTIGAVQAGKKFGKVLEDVVSRGDRVIVEERGVPVAALVPIEMYAKWKRDREAFFDTMEAAARRANMSEEEADELAQEAVEAVRKSKR